MYERRLPDAAGNWGQGVDENDQVGYLRWLFEFDTTTMLQCIPMQLRLELQLLFALGTFYWREINRMEGCHDPVPETPTNVSTLRAFFGKTRMILWGRAYGAWTSGDAHHCAFVAQRNVGIQQTVSAKIQLYASWAPGSSRDMEKMCTVLDRAIDYLDRFTAAVTSFETQTLRPCRTIGASRQLSQLPADLSRQIIDNVCAMTPISLPSLTTFFT